MCQMPVQRSQELLTICSYFFLLPDILVAPVLSVEVDRRSALTVAPKRPSTLHVSSISPQASSLTIPSISRGISPMIHLQLPDSDNDLQY
jgi:hypothetical protein